MVNEKMLEKVAWLATVEKASVSKEGPLQQQVLTVTVKSYPVMIENLDVVCVSSDPDAEYTPYVAYIHKKELNWMDIHGGIGPALPPTFDHKRGLLPELIGRKGIEIFGENKSIRINVEKKVIIEA